MEFECVRCGFKEIFGGDASTIPPGWNRVRDVERKLRPICPKCVLLSRGEYLDKTAKRAILNGFIQLGNLVNVMA